VSCSELPCFHFRSHNQFTIQELSHQLSAPLCPCCCSGVEVWINKASRSVRLSNSGYACCNIQCCLHILSLSSFNPLNKEHYSLQMVKFNRHAFIKCCSFLDFSGFLWQVNRPPNQTMLSDTA
jgi:hypothetical protein